jgi:predicted 3-demethylubiquinone-9 3-methyltransferase (glyoxalase superfamily)
MTDVTPCLWFDDDLGEAIEFYAAVFPDVTVHSHDTTPDGQTLVAEWSIGDQRFKGLNGGPQFQFNEAVSFSVTCADQTEVDRLWDSLVADGGEESQCGWLKDKFGLSWQVVPARLYELFSDPDPARAQAAMQAMFTMRKIVVSELEEAAAAAS